MAPQQKRCDRLATWTTMKGYAKSWHVMIRWDSWNLANKNPRKTPHCHRTVLEKAKLLSFSQKNVVGYAPVKTVPNNRRTPQVAAFFEDASDPPKKNSQHDTETLGRKTPFVETTWLTTICLKVARRLFLDDELTKKWQPSLLNVFTPGSKIKMLAWSYRHVDFSWKFVVLEHHTVGFSVFFGLSFHRDSLANDRKDIQEEGKADFSKLDCTQKTWAADIQPCCS